MAAILRNVKCDITAVVRPILLKFGVMMHLIYLNVMENQKFSNFKIQDNEWRPSSKLKKIQYLRNRLTKLTKFSMMAHISSQHLTSASKFRTFNNPKCQHLPLLKIVKCDISAIV